MSSIFASSFDDRDSVAVWLSRSLADVVRRLDSLLTMITNMSLSVEYDRNDLVSMAILYSFLKNLLDNPNLLERFIDDLHAAGIDGNLVIKCVNVLEDMWKLSFGTPNMVLFSIYVDLRGGEPRIVPALPLDLYSVMEILNVSELPEVLYEYYVTDSDGAHDVVVPDIFELLDGEDELADALREEIVSEYGSVREFERLADIVLDIANIVAQALSSSDVASLLSRMLKLTR